MSFRAILLLALVACGPAKVPSSESKDTADPGDDTGAGPVETGDPDTDTDTDTDSGGDTDTDTDTDSGGDTDTSASSEPPVSSRCIVATDTTGACTNGVYAEDWSGEVRYEWKITDGYNHSSLIAIEGGERRAITTLVSMSSWHMAGGLTVMPDGDLVLAGITLPYVTLTVGDESMDLGTDYVRFILRLSPEGEVRWIRTFIGVSSESVVVAGRSDDVVLVSGFIWQSTDFGDLTVATTMLFDMAFVAALDGDGEWLWATSPPVPSTGTTRIYFDDMTLNSEDGGDVSVRYLSSTDVSIGSFTCAARATCAATATVDADGEWTGVVSR